MSRAFPMPRTFLKSLVLVPVALLLMGAAVLVDPEPIAVPSGIPVKEVSKAIRAGIIKRGWVALKDEKGHMDAVLNVRKHMVKVDIAYDAKQVKITYVDSSNLDYEEKGGVRKIHKKYNQWIGNMVTDIQTELQSAAIRKE